MIWGTQHSNLSVRICFAGPTVFEVQYCGHQTFKCNNQKNICQSYIWNGIQFQNENFWNYWIWRGIQFWKYCFRHFQSRLQFIVICGSLINTQLCRSKYVLRGVCLHHEPLTTSTRANWNLQKVSPSKILLWSLSSRMWYFLAEIGFERKGCRAHLSFLYEKSICSLNFHFLGSTVFFFHTF